MLHELADRACMGSISRDSTSNSLVQDSGVFTAQSFNLKRQAHTVVCFCHLADCNFQIKWMGKLKFARLPVDREERNCIAT